MRLPRSLQGLPRETFVLALVAFCVALGFGIVVPAVPLFALEFGVGTTAAGAVVSAFALMRLLSGLAGGRLVDRVGERAALLFGLGVVAVSSLLAGLAVSYPQLLVLRGIGGVGSAVYQAALAGNFATGFSVLGVRSTVVPLLVVQGLQLGPGWIGAAFTLAALVQGVLLLPAGRAVDQVGRRLTLVAGGLVTAASLVGLAAATGPVSLLLAMTVFAAGASLLSVAPAAIVGDVVEGRGGTAIAVWQMSSDLGAVLGPLAAGLLVDRAGFGTALVASALVVAACALLGLRVPRAPVPVPP